MNVELVHAVLPPERGPDWPVRRRVWPLADIAQGV